jgi:hypothetical protein
MKLLVAMNCAFGCTSAFMNGYVNGKTGPVVGGIGKENVAFMSAVTPLVASLMSMPFASLGRFLGKVRRFQPQSLGIQIMVILKWSYLSYCALSNRAP